MSKPDLQWVVVVVVVVLAARGLYRVRTAQLMVNWYISVSVINIWNRG